MQNFKFFNTKISLYREIRKENPYTYTLTTPLVQAPGEECSTIAKSDWANRTIVKVSWCEPLETVSAKAKEYVDGKTQTTPDYLEAITASLGFLITSLVGLGKLPSPVRHKINTTK